MHEWGRKEIGTNGLTTKTSARICLSPGRDKVCNRKKRYRSFYFRDTRVISKLSQACTNDKSEVTKITLFSVDLRCFVFMCA